jgi:hypothetical protein
MTSLMMIVPTKPATAPIEDDWTKIARIIWKQAKCEERYRGYHTCVCGERSDNGEWILPDGTETNSLLIHYVACHRDEIPPEEMHKLHTLPIKYAKLRQVAAENGI